MSEFKVGDRVLYKGFEGEVVGQTRNLYEVRLDNAGFYLYGHQIEPAKEVKGCLYCKYGEPLNDSSNSNFALVVRHDEENYYIETEFDDGEWADVAYPTINYCPVCGRKLEVAE